MWFADYEVGDGALGLSCQTLRSVVGTIDTATAVVKDALLVALLNPKLGAWATKLTTNAASKPYVLAVLVVGTAGSVWVYRILDTAKGDCEKAEEQEKIQQILFETLKGRSDSAAPIRCEGGI